MIKVLTNDGLEAAAIESLKAAGAEVVNEHIEADKLGEALKDFDALVVRSATKVTADVLDKAEGGKLKLVVRAGVGIDNIDIKHAHDKGVTVKNTPNASSDSVAELVLAHMFTVARFLSNSNVTMRDGQWNKKKYKGVEIAGKTLGVIFGKQDNLEYEFCDMEDLLKKSDFISLHVPYDKEKGSVIGKKEFELMKDGAYLINCARGNVVDEDALLDALNSGKVAGAGIDVFAKEPTANEALVNHPNVSVTPHIGASTEEAQTRIGDEVASTIKEFFNL